MQQKKLVDSSRLEIAGIPLLYTRPAAMEKDTPTVFLYHGWSSRKENYLFMARILSLHGYQVLIPDAANHGERGILNYDDIGEIESYFWRTVISTVEEFPIILQETRKKLAIDPHRLAVMGSSMGGMIASGIFARHKNIKALIVINGVCAWEEAERRVRILKCVERTAGVGLETIRKYDPLQLKEALYPRPILLQHGDSDQSIPLATQQYFYNELKQLYRDRQENLRLTVIKNLNHLKTIGMLEEALDWLDRHLK